MTLPEMLKLMEFIEEQIHIQESDLDKENEVLRMRFLIGISKQLRDLQKFFEPSKEKSKYTSFFSLLKQMGGEDAIRARMR